MLYIIMINIIKINIKHDYLYKDSSFVLQPTKFCGKIFLRHNFIILHFCISVRFCFGKNACSISHTCARCEEIVSQQSERHFSGCTTSVVHPFLLGGRKT